MIILAWLSAAVLAQSSESNFTSCSLDQASSSCEPGFACIEATNASLVDGVCLPTSTFGKPCGPQFNAVCVLPLSCIDLGDGTMCVRVSDRIGDPCDDKPVDEDALVCGGNLTCTTASDGSSKGTCQAANLSIVEITGASSASASTVRATTSTTSLSATSLALSSAAVSKSPSVFIPSTAGSYLAEAPTSALKTTKAGQSDGQKSGAIRSEILFSLLICLWYMLQ
ncbi:hypothetical protein BJ741DRAFT_283243 [Chytriomyces cf. hyalinus JEL632]|nr:hypothetical protein BJ741DRAFT_283243 [Chytriomyces cf. hyalinus JEL632]